MDADNYVTNGCELPVLFSIVGDDCETYNNGRCFRTKRDSGGYYFASGSCEITAKVDVTLDVSSFDVKDTHSSCGFDWLEVSGLKYCAVTSPVGVSVTAGSTMTWLSSFTAANKPGFEICASCPDGFAHADDDTTNGCEWECNGIYLPGGTCTACSDTTTCEALQCDAGKYDSDGDATNGCESDYDCNLIDIPQGTCTACSDATTCEALQCNSGFDDSDGEVTNGCECLPVENGCSPCSDVTTCTDPLTCDPGKYDSDGDATNGCESNYDCNNINLPKGTCTACSADGTCEALQCNSGFDDSDNDATNGCECWTVNNGVCTACSADGPCFALQCNSGFVDADNDATNGCELPGLFSIVGDDCETYNDGRCFRTKRDSGGDYFPLGSCDITAKVDVTLDVSSFSVESHASCIYDSLEVGSTKYCGPLYTGPVSVTAGTTMKWKSDNALGFPGFEICASCPDGKYDADGDATNGCESNYPELSNGSCSLYSISGTCIVPLTCDAGKYDADGDATNGCESDFECMDLNEATCTACTDTTTCEALQCDAGKYDSDGDITNGCESDYDCNAINMGDDVCRLCAPESRYKENGRDEILVCENWDATHSFSLPSDCGAMKTAWQNHCGTC